MGREDILSLVTNWGGSIQFLTFKYDVNSRFFVDVLYQIGKVLPIHGQLRILIINWYWILSNSSRAS